MSNVRYDTIERGQVFTGGQDNTLFMKTHDDRATVIRQVRPDMPTGHTERWSSDARVVPQAVFIESTPMIKVEEKEVSREW